MEQIKPLVRQAVREAEAEVVELLRQLIQAQSVNPPGDTRGPAQILQDTLTAAGIDARLIIKEDVVASVVAQIGTAASPQLVFDSHIDTVGVGELAQWKVDPFAGEYMDGAIWGRGAADAKGPVAAMTMAMILLHRLGIPLQGSLCLAAVGDEESGAKRGTIPLLSEKLIQPDWAVIGEITSNQVAVAEKGILQINLTTRGKTAHASHPWEGVNAITQMVRLLSRLESVLQPRLKERTHPLTPRASMSINIIEGGFRANVVPDCCRAVIDRRILPTETVEEAVDEIKGIVNELQAEDPTLQVQIEVPRFGPPYHTSEDNLLVQTAVQVCQELGLSHQPVGYKQSSDGAFFAARGVPTILLGPGIAELAHAPNEFIAVRDVLQAVELYCLLALRLLA